MGELQYCGCCSEATYISFFSIANLKKTHIELQLWAQLELNVQKSNYSLHYQQSLELNSSHHLQNRLRAANTMNQPHRDNTCHSEHAQSIKHQTPIHK